MIILDLLLLMTLISAVIIVAAVKVGSRARRFEDELGDDLALVDDGAEDETARMKGEAMSG